MPAGLPVADVGTDHGRLPVWLVASGQVPRAVAIDLREGPLSGARARVARAGLGDRVDCRLASGCAGLDDGVRTVTIAGMGGPLMARILAELPPYVERVVLQPNVGARAARGWLEANGWWIDAERVLRDGGRWFAVFTARRARADDGPQHLARDDFGEWGVPSCHVDRDALGERLREEHDALIELCDRLGWPEGALQDRLRAVRTIRRHLDRLTRGA